MGLMPFSPQKATKAEQTMSIAGGTAGLIIQNRQNSWSAQVLGCFSRDVILH